MENSLGKEGEEVLNENGTTIIKLCIENDFIIGKVKFTHRNVHKYIREHRSRGERPVTDNI